MPTPKNGFQILNLHLKKNFFFKYIPFFFNVLLPKYYQKLAKSFFFFENEMNNRVKSYKLQSDSKVFFLTT